MRTYHLFLRAILFCITLSVYNDLNAQNRFLRGLEKNSVSQKWEFISIDMNSEKTTTLSVLPDTLVPWGNGTVTAFNSANQQYFYIAETLAPVKRYLVTLNAFTGKVIQTVSAEGIFAIFANKLDGFVYGIRYIAVTQLIKISPVTGTTTAITNNFNFINSFNANGSNLHEQNNELWLVGQQPMNNNVIARVNISSAAVQLTNTNSVRVIRHDDIKNLVYSITQNSNPYRFQLVEISSENPAVQSILVDSLPIQSLNGQVALVNPYLKEMYFRVIISSTNVPQMAMIDLSSGKISRFLPLPGAKNGLVFTQFPPNLRTHTLSGLVYLDRNANGMIDSGDIGISNQRINVQPGGYTLLTNQAGRYSVQVPDGSYSVTPFPTSLYYVSSSPLSYQLTFQSGNDVIDSLDFGISLIPGQPKDKISVSVSPTTARVGRDSQHTITVKNDGTTVLDGTVTYQEGEHMTVKSTSEKPSSVNNGTYTFEFSDLLPGEVRQINVIVNTPPDPELMGKTNTAIVTADAQSTTGSASDQKEVTQTIMNSYDPNDILVFDVQDTTLNAGVMVNYLIRFQNTGNDTAFRVMVEDFLPLDKLELETFEMLGASHTYYFDLDTNGRVQWTFPDIMLPDSSTNFIASNGFAAFRIKLKDSLTPLTQVINRAGIYFDFNPAVITNDALVRIPIASGIYEDTDKTAIRLYPNPTSDLLNVRVSFNKIENIFLKLTDMQGRTIYEQRNTTTGYFDTQFDCSLLPKGIYLLQLRSDSMRHTEKIVVK